MDISIKDRMPFMIPFKETSVRCPGKNFKLYKYTIEWLVRNGVKCEDVYVVSKSDAVREFIDSEGEKTGRYVNFVREPESSSSGDEAAYICARSIGASMYMVLPLTSPVRTDGLIDRMVAGVTDECDFVTTCRNVTDRSIFLLDDSETEFLHSSDERKGVMCQDRAMIDGAAYLVKTKFMDRIMSEDGSVNAKFWNGNFITVHNDTDFFFDIDTEEDMRRFQSYTNSRKRLVVVGNLEDGVNRHAEINSYDYVIRVNRMNNFWLTGSRTDLLLVDPTPTFFKLVDITKYSNICKKYVKNIAVTDNFRKNDPVISQIFPADVISRRRILDAVEYQSLRYPQFFSSSVRATNSFCAVLYAIDMFSEDYEISVSNENKRRFLNMKDPNGHGLAARKQLELYTEWEDRGIIRFIN